MVKQVTGAVTIHQHHARQTLDSEQVMHIHVIDRQYSDGLSIA